MTFLFVTFYSSVILVTVQNNTPYNVQKNFDKNSLTDRQYLQVASSNPWNLKWESHCLKIIQNVAFDFLILAFSTNFRPIKIDRSAFQKLPNLDFFCDF